MTTNDHSGGYAVIDVGDSEPPPGSGAGYDIGPSFDLEPRIARAESKQNGHVGRTNGLAAIPHDRYQPFALNELQRAYIMGRSREIPLGGIGCQLHVEYVRPALDLVRFERTWNALIRRNEILRLVIDGAEHQRILPEVPWFTVPVIPIAGSDPHDVEAAIAAIRDSMARHVYDVAVWPLHDVRIATLPDGSARLFFSFDLIGIDAASAFQLSGLVAKGYESEVDQEGWSPPALGYREHRVAEIGLWGGATWQRDRAFWQNLLPSLPAGPQLPYAAQFQDLTPPRFRRIARSLDRAGVQQLEAAAAKHGLTLPKVINAAFAEIIAAWASERHFLLNLPIFLPPDAAASADPVLGNHTSTVLIAADMRAGTFAERARGLWRGMARALRHRSYSGVNVLQDLRRLRGEGFAPLAPVVLTNLMTHPEQSGWPTDTHNSVTYTPQVTLDHQVLPVAKTLLFHWDSVVGAFHSGVIEAMADAHMALLTRLAEEDAAWTEPSLCVLGPEQRAARARVNATDRPLETGLLHDGFFATARRSPQAPAMIEGDRTVSYGELAALAEGVRRKLAESGVGPGEPVCCALPHGIDLATVALGTLAHGAVYAPLDPASPAHRRRREIEILQARVAFVYATSGKAIADLGLRTIDVQAIAAVADPQPQLHRASPDDRAYVIFTSGTTGDPKAIVISHRGATNTCADLIDRFSLGPQDRVLALSAPTFDLSVFDLFGLWAAGGCAVVPEAESRLDPAAWVAAIETHGVTIWNTVPALMTMLAAHCEAREQRLASLRLIMLSGDWIPPPLVPRMAGIAPAARLFGLGGATEASIWSIIHPIAPQDAGLPSIPYGVPLLNQTIHVLDETLAERPDHVEGDIFIGGIGLAEGYLGDPERTADAFIIHPAHGTRLYRTGDRGRRRPDGVVEFLGRRDTQLKCQGFRIEAGEVEAALRGVDGVADAVVEALGDRFDTKRLVAFVVPERREDLAPTADAGTRPKKSKPAVRTFDQPRPRIALARELAAEEVACVTKRRSARSFARKPVALGDLARLLTPLRHVETAAGPKYRYPSASGLYPVQVYLYCEPERVTGLDGGLYYVDPAGDLVLLSTERIATTGLHVAHNRDLAANAAFTLLLFGHMPAIAPSYGPLARDLCLLEAGYIGQALMETATETSCGLCPIGAMAFTTIAAAAGLPSEAQFLHAFVGGVRAEEASESAVVAPQAAAPAMGTDLAARVREHAASRLPAYMLPNDIILVDQFPLSANAKVDRGALRALAAARLNDVKAARPPSTEVERRLTGIAARLLNLDTVDIDREFFAMGADSVKLVEFSAAIEKEFGHRFQVIDAFANPTIRKLAAHLSAGTAAGAASDPLVSRARRRAESRRHTRPHQDGHDG